MNETEALLLTLPQRQVLDGILSQVGGRFEAVVAYGSRATGRARAGSDLDLAIIEPQDSKAELALWLALEESDLPFFFDLTLVGSDLDAGMKQAIVRDGIVLAGTKAHDWRSLIT